MTGPRGEAPSLRRVLGLWDVTTITAGTMLGTGIYLAAAFVPREVPQASLVLTVWIAGSVISIAGALTYAELGAMLPGAGGQYHYIKAAFGLLPGFLFGWTSLLAIQAGAIASLSVAFGEYLGAINPWFSSQHVIAAVPIGPWVWQPNTAQLAGVASVVVLSAINYFGVKQGSMVQGFLTAIKLLTLVGLIVAGLAVPARAHPDWTAPMPSGNLVGALGIALVAALSNYDGWYQATLSAGELRRPARDLPLGMIGGTVVVAVLYLLVNWVYFRAMPIEAIGRSPKIGEEATTVLFGPGAGRLISIAVLISIFGSNSSSIVGGSRQGFPMAQDGVFFKSLARIHPRYQTPTGSIIFLGVWSCVLVMSGSYEQLYTWALFTTFIFHAATAVAIIKLRQSEPDLPRPYRVFGYPWIPLGFMLAMVGLVINTFRERPVESLLGAALVLLGIPVFYWMRRVNAAQPLEEAG